MLVETTLGQDLIESARPSKEQEWNSQVSVKFKMKLKELHKKSETPKIYLNRQKLELETS